MKKLILILFIGLSFVQCNSDDTPDCSLVLCAAPGFIFEFIDADTGDNLLEGAFDNGTPDGFFIAIGETDDVLVFGESYTLNSLGQLNIFRSSEQYQISFPGVFDVLITYDLEVTPNGCCQDFSYENVAVTNATFEQIEDDSRLILRIFI